MAQNLSGFLSNIVEDITKKSTTLTSSQTWTVPSNIRKSSDGNYYVWVTAIGGGGSGGVGSNTDSFATGSATGGAAGQIALVNQVSVSPGQNISITIGGGASGASVSSDGKASGNNGGSTSFGSLVSVSGGAGGNGDFSADPVDGANTTASLGNSQAGATAFGGYINSTGSFFNENVKIESVSPAIWSSSGTFAADTPSNPAFSAAAAASDVSSSGGGGTGGMPGFAAGTDGVRGGNSASATSGSGAGSGGAAAAGSQSVSSGNGSSGKMILEWFE